MSQASNVLRRTTNGYAHWCPACKQLHIFTTESANRNGAVWGFDGNVESPTFTPSMLVKYPANPDATEEYKEWRTERTCHYFLRAGVIQFLTDCTHAMAGQSIPLPALPGEWTR